MVFLQNFYAVFNTSRGDVPFRTNPHLFTCACCGIQDSQGHEKLVTKSEDILVLNKRPLQPGYPSRRKAAKGRKLLSVCDKEWCCSKTESDLERIAQVADWGGPRRLINSDSSHLPSERGRGIRDGLQPLISISNGS